MANIFKSLDKIGIVVFAKRITLSIRKFFATKSEMDVVATALNDLDRRIDEAILTVHGNMLELDDVSEYCDVSLKWQSNTSVVFAGVVGVPIPTEKAMYSLADCIKQTNKLTLNVVNKNSITTCEWNELHWYIQCSLSGKVVYTTKYATPDADFQSVNAGSVLTPPTTIEITVTSIKGARHVHVTIENLYGRAYYYVKKQ